MEAIPKGNESSEPTIQARKGNPNITPKFNIAPEIWWLEDCFRFDMAYFQGRIVKLPGSNHLFNRYNIFKWKKHLQMVRFSIVMLVFGGSNPTFVSFHLDFHLPSPMAIPTVNSCRLQRWCTYLGGWRSNPAKTRPKTPIKTRVIWVVGI